MVGAAFISIYGHMSMVCSSNFGKKVRFSAQHVIVVSIVHQHSYCSSKEEIVDTIVCNIEERGCVEKMRC